MHFRSIKYPRLFNIYLLIFTSLALTLAGCGDGSPEEEVPMGEISIDLRVERLDLAMSEAAKAYA